MEKTMKNRQMQKDDHCVCPVWMAYTFDNPLRKLFHDPQKLYSPWLKEGMTALDLGCGLGYMSLGMAKLVGEDGKVLSVDMQQGMLDRLQRRAARRGLGRRIQPTLCMQDGFATQEKVDFALAFWMLHETPDFKRTLAMLYESLKPGGHLFVAEPKMHIDRKEFINTLDAAKDIGFEIVANPDVKLSLAVALRKP